MTRFTKDGVNYETSADLTGQANHLAATIEADLVKQKQPTNNGGFKVLNFGKTHPDVYQKLTSDHPIDLTRYQVANCYMGRVPLINSGGTSGANDVQQAVRTAVINKRAGGTGLITGRKAFQKPMKEGVELLHAVQDVYLDRVSPQRSRDYYRANTAGRSIQKVDRLRFAARIGCVRRPAAQATAPATARRNEQIVHSP